jgi:hypothetical protein
VVKSESILNLLPCLTLHQKPKLHPALLAAYGHTNSSSCLFVEPGFLFVCLFVEIDLSFGLFTGWFSSEVLRLLQENHASIHMPRFTQYNNNNNHQALIHTVCTFILCYLQYDFVVKRIDGEN